MTLELRNAPQQNRSTATLARITQAAHEVSAEIGYDRFTTADVAVRAGVSIGTVYRYFPDRIGLLDAIDSGRRVAADVRAERARQDAKWGQQNHPDGTGPHDDPLTFVHAWTNPGSHAINYATAAKHATDARAHRGTVTWSDILLEEVFEAHAESNPAKLRVELVQIAAVAQQWAEEIDRRTV
jgi:AcrR family transcriptional regulator